MCRVSYVPSIEGSIMLNWIRAGAGMEFGRRNAGAIVFLTVLVRLWPLTLGVLAAVAGVVLWRMRPESIDLGIDLGGWVTAAVVVAAAALLALLVVSIRARVWPLTWIVLAVAAAGTLAVIRPNWIQPAGIALGAAAALGLFVRFGLARR
jgi:hypothetical protein